jgi:hypothetical protein
MSIDVVICWPIFELSIIIEKSSFRVFFCLKIYFQFAFDSKYLEKTLNTLINLYIILNNPKINLKNLFYVKSTFFRQFKSEKTPK